MRSLSALTTVLGAVLAMALCSSVSAIANAQVEDVLPPNLVSLAFSPTSIDVSGSDQDVIFTLRITDGISGVATCNEVPGFSSTQLRLRSPSGGQFRGTVFCLRDLISGTVNDGVYQATVTFPQFSEAGTWQINSVLLVDTLGNSRSLNTTDLVAAGFPTELVIAILPTAESVPRPKTMPWLMLLLDD